MGAVSQIAADMDRLGIGGNNPPEPTPYDAIKAHLDDLLAEARNYADGEPATTQGQVDAIDRLIDDLRDGEKAADAARVEEKALLDRQIAAIQSKWNVYIAPVKNTVPGKVPLALNALKAAKTPFLQKQEAERLAAAAAAQAEAARLAQEAADALRATQASDLAGQEAAEEIITAATQAATVAKRTTKAATTGSGLRSYWTPTLTDAKAAARWAWDHRKPQLDAFLLDLARTEILEGKRTVPGFTITEERRA